MTKAKAKAPKRVGFTGSRNFKPKHERKVAKVLASLAPAMEFAITGSDKGVDAFVAQWFECNAPHVHIVVVRPGHDYFQDMSLHCLQNATMVHLPKESDYKLAWRQRDKKIVELSDAMVIFWDGRHYSGTHMSMLLSQEIYKNFYQVHTL